MRHERSRVPKPAARSIWAVLLTGALLFSDSAFADDAPDADEVVATTWEDDTQEDDDGEADPVGEGTSEGGAPEQEPQDSDAGDAQRSTDETSEEDGADDGADDDDAGTMSVPPAQGNNAVITVRVGGDRSGDTSVGGVEGVVLRLYDGGNKGPTTPVDEDWAECSSDDDGDCSFTVPDTNCGYNPGGNCPPPWAQVNFDRQFWVVLESAPAGWDMNEALVTGGAINHQATEYQFRTGSQLRAGHTYRSGTDFMAGSGNSNNTASGGTWQLTRSNPTLPQTCQAGLDVALVLDLSDSVDNAGATQDLKDAAIGFAEALEGTESALALYTFATNAPRNNSATGQNYDLMGVDENLATFTDRINDYQAEGSTNWDRGIYQVATSDHDYDLAVVVTDGLATVSGTAAVGPGSLTRFTETEEAIFSANALKAQGTRTLAVGVGRGIDSNPANLAAVSGPNAHAPSASINDADYLQAGWRELEPLLREVAMGTTCQAGITVTKLIDPYGDDEGPGEGWDFELTRTGGAGEITPGAKQTTDAAGEAAYTVQFDSFSATADVRLAELMTTEQEEDGWSLQSVVCTVNEEEVATTIEDGGVTINDLAVGDDAVCTVTNVQELQPGIELVKQAWDTEQGPVDPAARDVPRIDDGGDVASGSQITWTYTVTNSGQSTLENIAVVDDQEIDITCPETSLDAGESMTCWGAGPVAALDP